MENPNRISLGEFRRESFSEASVPKAVGELLWNNYRKYIDVEFPSPRTSGQWQLTNLGWVGHLRINPEWTFLLVPKVPLANLFGMLEYAYHLKSFEFLKGLTQCQSLAEFYEQLAIVLAKRIIDRGRKGFYRDYLSEEGRLPYVRGQFNLSAALLKPWESTLPCKYEEHTADIEDNQLLAWTMSRIARSDLCSDRSRFPVRRAYHMLHGLVEPNRFAPEACIGRMYNRLNSDYSALHGLCRFFLEHAGPSHDVGDHAMIPFVVDLARLYELFVAEWLRAHLPLGMDLKIQERVDIATEDWLHFRIDMVLYKGTDAVCVVDTKYKAKEHILTEDVAQVAAYAQSKNCEKAFLVYPSSDTQPVTARIGNVRVQTLLFSLQGDLEEAGQSFLRQLLGKSDVS